MSHRNLNIFASFNEQINLEEQKKCSKKGPSGNNFWREKKKHQQKFHWAVVLEQFYSDTHSAITIQYLFPFSPFLKSLTIGKMSSASFSNLPKSSCSISYSNHNIHPQTRTDPFCNHFNYACCIPTNL